VIAYVEVTVGYNTFRIGSCLILFPRLSLLRLGNILTKSLYDRLSDYCDLPLS